MPHDDGGHEPPGASSIDYINNVNPTRAYNAPGHKGFLPGHRGRPFGSKNKRSQSANDLIEAFGLEPLNDKLEQIQRLKRKIAAGVWQSDDAELECEKLLEKALGDVMQYRHQKLKSVESHTQVEIVQKLQAVEGMTDEEIRAMLAECDEVLKQLPPGVG